MLTLSPDSAAIAANVLQMTGGVKLRLSWTRNSCGKGGVRETGVAQLTQTRPSADTVNF